MTVKEIYANIAEDLNVSGDDAIYRDRLSIVNRAVDAVAGRIFNVISSHYYTEAEKTVMGGRVDISDLNIVGSDINVVGVQRYSPVTVGRYETLSQSVFDDIIFYVYARVGDELFIKPSATSVKVYYHRAPNQVTESTESVDIPSMAIDLVIMQGKKIVSERVGADYKLSEEMVRSKISDLMQQYGVTLQKKELDDAVQSLI